MPEPVFITWGEDTQIDWAGDDVDRIIWSEQASEGENVNIIWSNNRIILWDDQFRLSWSPRPERRLRIVTKKLQQVATYWPVTSEIDPATGSRILDTGQEIRCRWQESQELVKTDSGTELIPVATVYLPLIPQVGAYLALGRNADLVEARQILSVNRSPNLRGTAEVVSASLGRQ